jgi:hypothetical protein
VILQVKEEWGVRGNVRRGCSSANKGLSVGDSFPERETDLGCNVAASEETIPKILETVANIGRVGTEGVYPEDYT